MRKRTSQRPALSPQQTIRDARRLSDLGAHVDITVAVRLTSEQRLEIRALAVKRRVSQGDLAAAIGISQSSWTQRMKGVRAFTIPELAIVAERLGVPLGALITPERPQLASAA